MKEHGLKLVYDRTYPPATLELHARGARDGNGSIRPRGRLLRPVQLRRHGARAERVWVPFESNRRRSG
jgi:hypothetical protein